MSHYVFKLPDVGEGTTEAAIAQWHVAVGDKIKEDQPLVDLETDKAIVEIPSPASGIVVSIHGAVGEKIAVGSDLVVIETESSVEASTQQPAEDLAFSSTSETSNPKEIPPAVASSTPAQERTSAIELRPNKPEDGFRSARESPAEHEPSGRPKTRTPEPHSEADKWQETDNSGPADGGTTGRSKAPAPTLASPAVRKRARDLQIDLNAVRGSGPGGRVTHADLDALRGPVAANALPVRGTLEAAGEDQIVENRIRGIRRRIAERMQESKRRIPHFSYVEEVDVTALEQLRHHLNEKYDGKRTKLTPLPFAMRAIVLALHDHPEINARFEDDNGIVRKYGAVHIGIATHTANGLVVPVVRHAQTRDLWGCAAEAGRLAALARDGRATRSELTGSTITITSLGVLGGIASTPIINYPEVAIVGLNRIAERPVVRDRDIVVRKIMNLSCSFDHRVVDGWNAASFVQAVKGLLEQPANLFIE